MAFFQNAEAMSLSSADRKVSNLISVMLLSSPMLFFFLFTKIADSFFMISHLICLTGRVVVTEEKFMVFVQSEPEVSQFRFSLF